MISGIVRLRGDNAISIRQGTEGTHRVEILECGVRSARVSDAGQVPVGVVVICDHVAIWIRRRLQPANSVETGCRSEDRIANTLRHADRAPENIVRTGGLAGSVRELRQPALREG